MTTSRAAGGHAMAAARTLKGAARFAAFSAGQAAVSAHVAAHDLGAAAYAIKAIRSSVETERSFEAGVVEREWQRSILPERIRELVLDDQHNRNELCWFVFEP